MIDKRKEILQAALRLFVEQGFHGTATSKIAQEAGVANGTLFHHFKTKDDLIIRLYLDIKKQLLDFTENQAQTQKNTKEKVKTHYIYTLYWALDHPLEFHFMQQVSLSPFANQIPLDEIQEQKKAAIELIEEAMEGGYIQKLPIDFIHSLIGIHIFGVYQYISKKELGEKPKKELIEQSFELLWKMLT
jgi:AcrR family transcriptional regulator